MRGRAARVAALAALVTVLVPFAWGCTTPKTLELTQADSGSTQQMKIDQQLRITLEANPTTGYEWAVEGEVPAQLEQVGKPQYTAGSTALGAGGKELWTFKAKSAGQGSLKLKYWRSFEPTAVPAEQFEVRVKVE